MAEVFMIRCPHCGNKLAANNGECLVVTHKHRTVVGHIFAIICERCGRTWVAGQGPQGCLAAGTACPYSREETDGCQDLGPR